jgi:prefoldin subunit 5
MPGGMGYGMQCPACGETMAKPSKEQFLEMLERRKQRLAAVLEHINMEIDKLKETMEEEKKEKT